MRRGLPTVREDAPLEAATSLAPATRCVGQPRMAPWQSPAVRELTQAAGRGKPEASPMILEGPTGLTFAAIGEQRDHAIASKALRDSMSQAKQCCSGIQSGGSQPGGSAIAVSVGGGRLAAASSHRHRNGAAFGAVYEYRDGAGKPCYVAGTSELPEAAFARDFAAHAPVRALFDGPSAAPPGRASVVWAGIGGGPVGDAELKAARDAVCKERSERQKIQELRGAKPYSRHSHMLA